MPSAPSFRPQPRKAVWLPTAESCPVHSGPETRPHCDVSTGRRSGAGCFPGEAHGLTPSCSPDQKEQRCLKPQRPGQGLERRPRLGDRASFCKGRWWARACAGPVPQEEARFPGGPFSELPLWKADERMLLRVRDDVKPQRTRESHPSRARSSPSHSQRGACPKAHLTRPYTKRGLCV